MVLKELILKFLLWEAVVVLKELIFNSLLFWEGVIVLEELISIVSNLGGCGGLERTDFSIFYFGRV